MSCFGVYYNGKIKERDVLFKKAKRLGNLEDWTVFKQANNRVCGLIRKAKEHHFKNQFAESKDNPKKLWCLIRNLTRQDVNKHGDIRRLKDLENIVTDKRSVAELFNLYFANQPFNLLNNLSSNMQSIISFGKIKDQRTNKNCVFTISYITPQNVIEVIRNMSPNKATGLDGVGVKILKVAASAIAPPLCTLINYCIPNSTFPHCGNTRRSFQSTKVMIVKTTWVIIFLFRYYPYCQRYLKNIYIMLCMVI